MQDQKNVINEPMTNIDFNIITPTLVKKFNTRAKTKSYFNI